MSPPRPLVQGHGYVAFTFTSSMQTVRTWLSYVSAWMILRRLSLRQLTICSCKRATLIRVLLWFAESLNLRYRTIEINYTLQIKPAASTTGFITLLSFYDFLFRATFRAECNKHPDHLLLLFQAENFYRFIYCIYNFFFIRMDGSILFKFFPFLFHIHPPFQNVLIAFVHLSTDISPVILQSLIALLFL